MDAIVLLLGLVLGLILTGVVYQHIGAWRDRLRFTHLGRWVRIRGGQNLFVVERGSTGPTVVFESGIAATHLNWHRIQDAVSSFARTVAYDRAGLGWSSPCTSARTPSKVASELHDLLEEARIAPPYVLVGHSFGGFVMRRFAALYRDEVAGVLLVDPMRCDEWPPVDETKRGTVERGARLCGFAIPIAHIGVARLAVTSLLCRSGRVSRWLTQAGGDGAEHVMGRVREEIGKMPPETWPMVAAHWSRPSFYAGMRAHVEAVPDSVREMLTAEPMRGVPVVVLTPDSSKSLPEEALRCIGENVEQIIVPHSAHWLHLDQPQIVIETIRSLAESSSQRVGAAISR